MDTLKTHAVDALRDRMWISIVGESFDAMRINIWAPAE